MKETALSLSPEAACAIYADASGVSGHGAALGDALIQGTWSGIAKGEGVNRCELWVLGEALRHWAEHVRHWAEHVCDWAELLILALLGDVAAVVYANHGRRNISPY